MERVKEQWSILQREWSKHDFDSLIFDTLPSGWVIKEVYKDKTRFSHFRSLDGSRSTDVECSLVGVTLLDTKKPLVFVTEGVSDFLALKLMFPDKNVLGHTHLSWSKRDVSFLSYFETVTLFSDQDVTGIKAVSEARQKFPPGKVKIVLPSLATSKDVCEDYIKMYKYKNLQEDVINYYKTFIF